MTDGPAISGTALPLAALEIALNRLLALDPLTLERLAALDGRVIRLEVPALGLQFTVAPHANGLQWLSPAPETVDAHISGSLADLLRAQAGGGLEGLQIEGDKHLASAFASALREARIDWPELLTPWLGTWPRSVACRRSNRWPARWPRAPIRCCAAVRSFAVRAPGAGQRCRVGQLQGRSA